MVSSASIKCRSQSRIMVARHEIPYILSNQLSINRISRAVIPVSADTVDPDKERILVIWSERLWGRLVRMGSQVEITYTPNSSSMTRCFKWFLDLSETLGNEGRNLANDLNVLSTDVNVQMNNPPDNASAIWLMS